MNDLVAQVLRLAEVLEPADIPHAIGGATALGFHAPPRATQEIDLNLFLEPERAGPALRTVRSAGIDIDVPAAMATCRERGDARGMLENVRVDIFVNSTMTRGE